MLLINIYPTHELMFMLAYVEKDNFSDNEGVNMIYIIKIMKNRTPT